MNFVQQSKSVYMGLKWQKPARIIPVSRSLVNAPRSILQNTHVSQVRAANAWAANIPTILFSRADLLHPFVGGKLSSR
jgi:hypothetical protein